MSIYQKASAYLSQLGRFAATGIALASLESPSLEARAQSPAEITAVAFQPSNDAVNTNLGYSVQTLIDGINDQHRLYKDDHHFLSVLFNNRTFVIRAHPGQDPDGWGFSWYLNPFFPGAPLTNARIHSITSTVNSIDLVATGRVSRAPASTYGNWRAGLSLNYDAGTKTVTGTGTYDIALSGAITAGTGDLNLYKLASNFLTNVPVVTGGIADTGDMTNAFVTGNFTPFTWNPKTMPGHFPGDITSFLGVDMPGCYNIVDTIAQGHSFAIKPAYKPGVDILITSTQAGLPMIFGAIFTTSRGQDFTADNIGITPVIKATSLTTFHFDVAFSSTALPDDQRGRYLLLTAFDTNLAPFIGAYYADGPTDTFSRIGSVRRVSGNTYQGEIRVPDRSQGTIQLRRF